MKEKVIDIYPPEENRTKKISCGIEKEGKKCKGGIFALIFFIFLLIGGYFYYVSFKTEIVIYPKVEEMRFEEDILVRTVGSIGGGEIRGVVLSERISDQKEFEIEGKRMLEKKAKGEIKVCQDYRDSAVTFVEGTRFISDGGKIFFATSGFSLPAKNVDGGCNVVEVIAAQAGEDYNVPSDSKFALPGLHGTTIYGNVKGVSFLIKEEGVLKEVPYLDDDTMEKAENQMKEELFVKGKELLLEKYEEEYFLENESQYSIAVVERDLIEKDEKNFYFKLDVNVKIIAISKKDINDLISKSLEEGYTWRKDTEDIKVSFKRINFEENEADIFFEFSGEIYEDIDEDYWKREARGIDFSKVKSMIESEINTKDVVVKNKPFGLSKVANSIYRIEIKTQFDKN
jgi:hypothetical protein